MEQGRTMSFVSYAQNLEDVMLYRALKHIEHGFYVDVGAHHPEVDSVTKAFYERGWRGINIEPLPQYIQLLRQQRPQDTNLDMLVSNHKGELLFYEVQDTGLSTVKQAYVARIADKGHKVSARKVRCTTLDNICEEYKVDVVHFLKIDVEGAEKEVLEGFSFQKVRPWIVVIEANEPNSTQDVSSRWEAIILSKGYEYVYYDGLNRFYLAVEHRDLKPHFKAPPNIFDRYVPHSQYLAQRELANEIQPKEMLTKQLQQISHGFSRRLTAPLRWFGNKVIHLILSSSLIKIIIKSILRFLFRFRLLVRLGNWMLKNRPNLRAKIGSVRIQSSLRMARTIKNKSEILESLPESARTIYLALKDAYNKK